MKQIEKMMLEALREKKNWKSGNTRVEFMNGGAFVYLHENLIFLQLGDGRKYGSFAGWDTTTTRSRLRALGAPITSKAGRRYAYGMQLPTEKNEKNMFFEIF